MLLYYRYRVAIVAVCLLLTSCTSLISATTSEPINVDPGKRTLGVKIDDRQIETIAAVNINKAHPDLSDAVVRVHSYNAVVLLVGQVPTQQLRQLAGDTVQKISS